jgi:hypothetical protein
MHDDSCEAELSILFTESSVDISMERALSRIYEKVVAAYL